MDTGIYQGVAAMRSTEKRMDTIAANLANIGVRGFKKQASVTRTFNVGEGARRHQEIVTDRRTDFAQGELLHTGNKLDLAFDGPGFFAVDGPNGRMYTRNGSFRLDDKGNLLSDEGHPVAWEGSRGTFQPTGGDIVIDGTGTVLQGEAAIGKISLVEFPDTSLLAEDGSGYWIAPKGVREQKATSPIQQGFVERSNVNAIDELIAMVLVQRRFENSSTVMRSIDQTYKRLNQPHS